MKTHLLKLAVAIYFSLVVAACNSSQAPHLRLAENEKTEREQEEEEESEEYDGPAEIMKLEFEKTKDPRTGRVPRETLWPIIEYTEQLKQDLRQEMPASFFAKIALNGWSERGPNSDNRGAYNGNYRGPNNDGTSGRIRAIMIDAADNTGNTVFAGGVAGGLWKTTAINSANPNWALVNDRLSNLAITGICQAPGSASTMYLCTGEANYNSDAVQGDGVFKSTNGGATWTQLAATTSFDFCSRIICDASGNVYVGTRGGLKRSTNGGSTWTDITPSGINAEISDIEIGASGRMHVTSGFVYSGGTVYYRYTTAPSTVTSASGWSSPTTPFATTGMSHVVIACEGTNLLALPSASSGHNVAAIYKSTDGGDTWSATGTTPGFSSGQGWFCLAAAINPASTSEYMVGSLNLYKSTNSGSTWAQNSHWSSSSLQYVHADQHEIIWYTASSQSRVLVACDGGLFYSNDGGSTWDDRNTGLRIKQFFSVALHPTANSNYMLGGAQDNGSHAFSNSGLSSSVEVMGGDGAFVHIDQDQPQYQFTSYVYNNYYRSTNNGVAWAAPVASNTGLFINPTDYDHAANIMYCSEGTSGYRRWTDPQTGATSDVVAVTALGGGSVYALAVSPFTANRVYFGTSGGTLVRVDNAQSVTTPVAGTSVGTSLGTISSITFGGSEDTIVVTSSSYSGTQVWYTTNGTSATPTFTAKDGNLPNMPVRWSLAVPFTYGKRVMLATEAGIWVTKDITAASPTWVADAFFPNVRTDMLKYRSSDKTVAAATHGRGMWTAIAPDAASIALPYNEFVLKGNQGSSSNILNWTFKTARQAISFDVEASDDGTTFRKIATQAGGAAKEAYSYEDQQTASQTRYYRVKSLDQYGLTQYSNIIALSSKALNGQALGSIFPNPVRDQLNLPLSSAEAGTIRMQLYSVNGQVVREHSQQFASGKHNISMNASGIAPGNYLLIATVGGKRYSFVVLKQ